MSNDHFRPTERHYQTLVRLKDIVLDCLVQGRAVPPDLVATIGHLSEIVLADDERFEALDLRVRGEWQRCGERHPGS